VCLQETHLRPSHALRHRGYTTPRYDRPAVERSSGGTAILVEDCICCVPASLRSPLQVIAVRAHLTTLHFALCNIYLPPSAPARRADLSNLLSVTATTHTLIWDLNTKHILWGGNLTDDRGTLVYDVCAYFDFILLKTGAYAHLWGQEPCLPWILPFVIEVQQSALIGQFSPTYTVGTTAGDCTISTGVESSEVDHQTCRLGWFLCP
jgi:hypothetical protein